MQNSHCCRTRPSFYYSIQVNIIMAAPNEEHDEMLVIGAVQCPLRKDHQHPLDTCNQVIKLMKEQSRHRPRVVHLFVLPELAPLGYSKHSFANYLPNTQENLQIFHAIHQNMVQAAQELQAYICFGTIGVLPDDTCTIRQVVVDTQGRTVATYDKMLLCDYGDCAETRYFTAGTSLESFCVGNFTIGILICADMRNPVHARRLVSTRHVQVVIQPAAFSRDFSFYTWKSFQTTRAVENSIYWVGVNYSGDYHGESCFTPPWVDEHHKPVAMKCQTGVLVGTVKRSTLNHVRATMPYYMLLMKEGTVLHEETS